MNKHDFYEHEIDKQNTNYKTDIEYYEVLTDGVQLWIFMDDLVKICREIKYDQLINFNFREDNDVVFGKRYVAVTEDFLKFVANNTRTPKYLPCLALLKTKERERSYEKDNQQDERVSMSYANLVDGTTEIVYEGRSR